ncbi:MAG: MFS transporter [Alphaproteobacteria bacterium]|nr:MFS transporter [Alphaproteobacteria bacterium]
MSDYQSSSVEVRYGWVVVWASLILNGIALGAPTFLFVALKPIAADLGGERWVPSFAYSVLMVGTGIGGVAMGWWMDKRGILQPILFGSVMICVGSLVASQSEGRWGLWLANGLLIGLLGKAAMIAPLVANATRWFDRRRGLAIAIIASGQGLAGAVWPTVFGHLERSVGWRETYIYYAVFAAVTMLPLCWLIRPKPPVPPPGPVRLAASRGGKVLDWPPEMVQGALWIAVIGCCGAMAMPIVHLVSHTSDLGYAEERGAEILSVLMVAGFFSRIGFGMLSDRIGAAPTLLIGSMCQFVMMIVFAMVESLTGLYVAALMFGLGFAGIMPCYPLLLRLWFPASEIGWRVGAQYMFAGAGMAIGGTLAGYIFDVTGSYAPAFLSGAAFNAMNFMLIAMLHLRSRSLGFSPRPV